MLPSYAKLSIFIDLFFSFYETIRPRLLCTPQSHTKLQKNIWIVNCPVPSTQSSIRTRLWRRGRACHQNRTDGKDPMARCHALATCDNHYATELCKATIKNFSCNDSSTQDQFLYNMFPTAYLLGSRFCCPFETLLRTFTQWQSTQVFHTPVPLGNVGKMKFWYFWRCHSWLLPRAFHGLLWASMLKCFRLVFFLVPCILSSPPQVALRKAWACGLSKVVDLRSLYSDYVFAKIVETLKKEIHGSQAHTAPKKSALSIYKRFHDSVHEPFHLVHNTFWTHPELNRGPPACRISRISWTVHAKRAW